LQQLHKIKVLIIDDEEDFCQVIASFLKKRGHVATFTHTLESGFEQLKKINPQILFLDNHLPDGRGWQHIQHLVKNYPSMKINLISAYKDNNNLVPVDENVTVLEKPLSLRQLDEILNSFTYSSSA
jgi:DNA-binding NtrC family response regulator